MTEYHDWKQFLESSFHQFVTALSAYLPSLIGAVILLVLGVFAAWLVKSIILRVGKGVDNLAQRAGIGLVGRMRWSVSDLLASVMYWLVILFFTTAAAQSLGLPGLSDWLRELISYLPSVLASMIIVGGGFILGGMARDRIVSAAAAAHFVHVDLLGSIVRALVILLAFIIGLSRLGIDISLVEYLLAIFTAAIMAALALAFGLGAGPSVSNVIALRNIRRHYRPGQHVRVGEIEGEILELSSSFVVLDTESGRTLIPAKTFDEQVSTLLDSEVPGER